jgi:predicted metallopeptidase
MATYVPAPELEQIARSLITRYSHNLPDLNVEKIGFLLELDSPSKTKLAITKKVDKALKIYYSDKDYIIIFFQKRLDELTPAQRHILVFHELLHCNWDGEKLNHHDVEEFYEIGAAFGIDWPFNPTVRDPLAERIEMPTKPAGYGGDSDD